MENIKIKISKEQAELFEMTGNMAVLSNKDVYMSIPYWIKETGEEYVYEYLTVEQLPDDIRNNQPRYSEEEVMTMLYCFHYDLVNSNIDTKEEWFEQFKNK